MKKLLLPFFLLIISLLIPINVFASACPFSLSVPEYYNQISENEWYTDSFLINGSKTEVSISASCEISRQSFPEAFSDDSLNKVKSDLQSINGFEYFISEPEAETTKNRYMHIVASYVFECDGAECGAIIYYFYSDDTCCTISFAATDPLFIVSGASTEIINSITFEQDFYSENDNDAVPNDTISSPNNEEDERVTTSIPLIIGVTAMVIVAVVGLCTLLLMKKKQIRLIDKIIITDAEEQVSGDYFNTLKRAASKYLPDKISAEHFETIFDMLNLVLAGDAIKLMLELDWKNAKIQVEHDTSNAEEIIAKTFAESGFKFNHHISCINPSFYENKIKNSSEEELLKAFIAADFYAFHLKEEYTVNLRKLQKIIAREMLNRGYTNIVSKEVSPFEALQAKCNEAVRNAPDADETKAMVIELGRMMLSLEKLYVLIDKDFNDQFPFIGTDGRIEVCSSLEIAQAVGNYYHEQKLGHVAIREYTGVADALKSFQKMGIAVVRLDNGVKPVDIWLKDILEPVSSNVIEADNIGTKGMFLRELQYGYRLSKADNTQGEWAFKKGTTEFMLTMRYNAYRDFANGLCYVLAASGPYIAGKTFYTEKALEKAKKLLAKRNLPETSLIADGDSEYAVYTGPLEVRVSHKPGQQDMATSFVCAFTGREEIEIVRKNFMNYGINDGVLAITFDELYSHAQQCAGILVDMPTYGLELKKEEFPEVLKWKVFPGGIIVNINDKKE